MKKVKKIALVAHDNCKKELMEWVDDHWRELVKYEMVCTGTTGNLVCLRPLFLGQNHHNSLGH